MSVGIDIGNATCLIAQAKRGGVDMILNENSNRQNPSLVSFAGQQRFVGEQASSQVRSNYRNTLKGFKRLMGLPWEAAAGEVARLPFQCQQAEDGTVGMLVQYNDAPTVVTPQAALATLLRKMASVASAANGGARVAETVLSVPGYYTDAQRRAVQDAVRISGLNCLRLLNEHTAVALSYGIYKSARNLFHASEPQYVCFVDMGHGAFTVSVVEFVQGQLQVKGTAFDRDLGGRDFTDAIVSLLADAFQEKHGADVRSNPKAMIKLASEAEAAKKKLSPHGVSQVAVNVECLMNDIDFQHHLELEQFEGACAPLVARIAAPVQAALAAAGVSPAQLSCVEIVGGGTRVPMVKRALAEVLQRDAESQNFGLSTTLNADEAVARGCALMCAIDSPLFKVKEFKVQDAVYYPIRLSWEQAAGGAADGEGADGEAAGQNSITIFQQHDSVPRRRHVTFRKANAFELTAQYDDAAAPLLPPGAPMHIGRFTVNAPAPTEDEASPEVRVFVSHDNNGVFAVDSAQHMQPVVDPPAAPASSEEGSEGKGSGEGEGEGKGEDSAGEGKGEDAAAAEDGKAEDGKAAEDGKVADEGKAADEGKEGESKGADGEKAEKKKKKRYRKVDLTVDGAPVGGMAAAALDDAVSRENAMTAQDREIQETADMRNDLETYIYRMRDAVISSLREFVTDEDLGAFNAALEGAEEWLYSDEGFDATKAVFSERLVSLEALGGPIERRAAEAGSRPAAVQALTEAFEAHKRVALSSDEQYSHLGDEDRETVKAKCAETETWLYDQLSAQGDLPPTADPVLTTALISERRAQLDKVCTPIVTRPKPIPKKEDKKAEPAEAEAAGGKGEGAEAGAEAGAGADADAEAEAGAKADDTPQASVDEVDE